MRLKLNILAYMQNSISGEILTLHSENIIPALKQE